VGSLGGGKEHVARFFAATVTFFDVELQIALGNVVSLGES
jgi:hypothetical protein